MYALRLTASQVPRVALATQARMLSSQTSLAVEKLRSSLEEYRQKHYTQEIPTRFKKDIVRAAALTSDCVAFEGLQRVLANIGAETKVTHDDIKSIFDELGNGIGGISTQRLLQIL